MGGRTLAGTKEVLMWMVVGPLSYSLGAFLKDVIISGVQ